MVSILSISFLPNGHEFHVLGGVGTFEVSIPHIAFLSFLPGKGSAASSPCAARNLYLRPYSPFRAYGGRRIEPHQPFLLSVMTMAGKERTFKALPQKGGKEEEEEDHNLRHHRHGTHFLFFFEPRSLPQKPPPFSFHAGNE